MGPPSRIRRGKILQVPGISPAEVRLASGTALEQSMISEEGKMRLAWSEGCWPLVPAGKNAGPPPDLAIDTGGIRRWCRVL